MAKGIRSGGYDFDDLFDPDVKGDGPSVPNLRSGGAPLRYAAIKYGQKRADVGYRQDGVDVSNFWAAKGTARYALPINGQHFSAGYSAPTNQSGSAFVNLSVILYNNGTYVVLRGDRYGNAQLASGTWESSWAAGYDVRMIAEDTAGSSTGGYQDTGYVNAGTSVGRTLSVPAASAQSKEGYARIRILIARAGQGDAGIVSDTTITTYLAVNGWV